MVVNDFDITQNRADLDSSNALSIDYLKSLTKTSDTGIEGYENENDLPTFWDIKKSNLYKDGKIKMDVSTFRTEVIGNGDSSIYNLDDAIKLKDISIGPGVDEDDDFPYDLYTPVEYIQVGYKNGSIPIKNIAPVFSQSCRFEGDIYVPSSWGNPGSSGILRQINMYPCGANIISTRLAGNLPNTYHPITGLLTPMPGYTRNKTFYMTDGPSGMSFQCPITANPLSDTFDYLNKKTHIIAEVKHVAVYLDNDVIKDVTNRDYMWAKEWANTTQATSPGRNIRNEMHTRRYSFSMQDYEYTNGVKNPAKVVYIFPTLDPCRRQTATGSTTHGPQGFFATNLDTSTGSLAEVLSADPSVMSYINTHNQLPLWAWNRVPYGANNLGELYSKTQLIGAYNTSASKIRASRWGLFGYAVPVSETDYAERYFGGLHSVGDWLHAYYDNGGFNGTNRENGIGYFLGTAPTSTGADTSSRYWMYDWAIHTKPCVPGTRVYNNFKLWQDDELVGSFVTCRRKSDGLYGVYNRVDKTFSCSEYDEWVIQNNGTWPYHFNLTHSYNYFGYTIPAAWGDDASEYDDWHRALITSYWTGDAHGATPYHTNSSMQSDWEYNNLSIAGPTITDAPTGVTDTDNGSTLATLKIEGKEPIFGKDVTEGVYFDFNWKTLRWNFPSKDNPLKFRVYADPSIDYYKENANNPWAANTGASQGLWFGACPTVTPQRWATEYPAGEAPTLTNISSKNIAKWVHQPTSSKYIVTTIPNKTGASVTIGSQEGIKLTNDPYFDVSMYFSDPDWNGAYGTSHGNIAINLSSSYNYFVNKNTLFNDNVVDGSVFNGYYNPIVFIGDKLQTSGDGTHIGWYKSGYTRPTYLDYTETPNNIWNCVPIRGYIMHNIKGKAAIEVKVKDSSIWPDQYTEIESITYTYEGAVAPRWNEVFGGTIQVKPVTANGNDPHFRIKNLFYENFGGWVVVKDTSTIWADQHPAIGWENRFIVNYTLSMSNNNTHNIQGKAWYMGSGGVQDWLYATAYYVGSREPDNIPTWTAYVSTPADEYAFCGNKYVPLMPIPGGEGDERLYYPWIPLAPYLNENNPGTRSPGALNPIKPLNSTNPASAPGYLDLPTIKFPMFLPADPELDYDQDLPQGWSINNVLNLCYILPDSSNWMPRRFAGKTWTYDFCHPDRWNISSPMGTGNFNVEVLNPIWKIGIMSSDMWHEYCAKMWTNSGLYNYNKCDMCYDSSINYVSADYYGSGGIDDPSAWIIGIEIVPWNTEIEPYSSQLAVEISDPSVINVSYLDASLAAKYKLNGTNLNYKIFPLQDAAPVNSGWAQGDPLAPNNEVAGENANYTPNGVKLQFYIIEPLTDHGSCTVTWYNADGHNNGDVSCHLDINITPYESWVFNAPQGEGTGGLNIRWSKQNRDLNGQIVQAYTSGYTNTVDYVIDFLDHFQKNLDTLHIESDLEDTSSFFDNFTIKSQTNNLIEWRIDKTEFLGSKPYINLKISPVENIVRQSIWHQIEYIRIHTNPSILQIPYADSSVLMGKTGNQAVFYTNGPDTDWNEIPEAFNKPSSILLPNIGQQLPLDPTNGDTLPVGYPIVLMHFAQAYSHN